LLQLASSASGLRRDPLREKVAVLINPKGEYAEQQAKDLQEGAHRIGRQILILNASSERDIDNAFRTLIARQAAGLLVASDPFFLNRREQLIALASYHGIPAIYEWREYALAGGLMSYGTSITDFSASSVFLPSVDPRPAPRPS
jgi:putative tryptophan/tyrosine transport system substrate-binding protein